MANQSGKKKLNKQNGRNWKVKAGSQAQQIESKEEEEFKKELTAKNWRSFPQPFSKALAMSSPISLSRFAAAVPNFIGKGKRKKKGQNK